MGISSIAGEGKPQIKKKATGRAEIVKRISSVFVLRKADFLFLST
jgi:hypothetical protein